MNAEKPLKMGTCTKCGLNYFISDPRPGPIGATHVQTYDAPPATANDTEIIPYDCHRCGHRQFFEFYYGP